MSTGSSVRRLHHPAMFWIDDDARRAAASGAALLNAMAARLPIITANVAGPGVPWVDQHGVTGLNVLVRDAPALVGALVALLADRDRARAIGETGQQPFLQRFAASGTVSATAALYRRLLESSPEGVGSRTDQGTPGMS